MSNRSKMSHRYLLFPGVNSMLLAEHPLPQQAQHLVAPVLMDAYTSPVALLGRDLVKHRSPVPGQAPSRRYMAMLEKESSVMSLNCTFWALPVHSPKAELKTTGQMRKGDPAHPPAAVGWCPAPDEHGGTKGEVNHLSSHSCQVH